MPSLRDLRTRAGLSMRELAEVLGIDRSYISRIESGQRIPTHETCPACGEPIGVADRIEKWARTVQTESRSRGRR